MYSDLKLTHRPGGPDLPPKGSEFMNGNMQGVHSIVLPAAQQH